MVGVGHDGMVDDDALLRLEAVDETAYRFRRHHPVLGAVHHQPRRGAGGEEGEIIEARRRRHRNEALDLRPPHQKLHGDPRAERDARDPTRAGVGIVGLHPVERGGGVGQLAGPVVEQAFAPPHAAKVEAQHGKAAPLERVIEVVDHLVVHRAPILGVRMQDERDGRVGRGIVVVARLDPPRRAADIHLGHEPLTSKRNSGDEHETWDERKEF